MRLGPEHLFDLAFPRDARLSPDGRHIAYAVSRTSDHERLTIALMITTGLVIGAIPFDGSAHFPRWSPDGGRIAFVGEGRLYHYTLATRQISPPLTPSHTVVDGAPDWSPDGTCIAVALFESAPDPVIRRHVTRQVRADGYGLVDKAVLRLHVVALDGECEAVTPPSIFALKPQWSPNGRSLLFVATDRIIPAWSPMLSLLLRDTGEIRNLLSPNWFVTQAYWLPDSRRIAIAGSPDDTLTVPVVSLWVLDSETGSVESRLDELPVNIGARCSHDMPAVDLTHGNVLVIDSGSHVFANVQRGGNVEIWRVALDGPKHFELVESGPRSCFAVDAKAGLLVFAACDLHAPLELWLSSREQANAHRLTRLNDAVIDAWEDVEDRKLSYVSDSLEIEGWAVMPKGSTFPLPTVLFIHGGPFGATGNAFRYDFRMLASHGYAVLFANFRGSAGYGDTFSRAIMGQWGAAAFPDHVGIVDAAIAAGIADPDRLGVWGHSYGGFAAAWIVGHCDRFRAALAESACTNFETLYRLTDLPEVFAHDLGGKPHEIPDIYRERSPINYAHRCTTPTLFFHGEADLRCPIGEAEQFIRTLQDVGCIAELWSVPECAHLGAIVGPLKARIAQKQALLTWFGRYL